MAEAEGRELCAYRWDEEGEDFCWHDKPARRGQEQKYEKQRADTGL